MQEVILVKLGEIVLKGLNRRTFEDHDPEDCRCQTAILAVCVHAFVTVKPKG